MNLRDPQELRAYLVGQALNALAARYHPDLETAQPGPLAKAAVEMADATLQELKATPYPTELAEKGGKN